MTKVTLEHSFFTSETPNVGYCTEFSQKTAELKGAWHLRNYEEPWQGLLGFDAHIYLSGQIVFNIRGGATSGGGWPPVSFPKCPADEPPQHGHRPPPPSRLPCLSLPPKFCPAGEADGRRAPPSHPCLSSDGAEGRCFTVQCLGLV